MKERIYPNYRDFYILIGSSIQIKRSNGTTLNMAIINTMRFTSPEEAKCYWDKL